MTADTQNPLDQALLLLEKPARPAPSVRKAFWASVALAAASLWLAAAMVVGPVFDTDTTLEAQPVVTQTVKSGTEGGFELSAAPLPAKAGKTAIAEAVPLTDEQIAAH
ncbi:hypothetical protein PQU92_01025 [Asticcacaulis sp. BYS171W]|uniref:Uncharacterized protein n=1 Tax=Asticcacaulis aquaticus TaxID=2984212 RepID=A0ABT5HP55_9CAUL|nr:hypothetical protein [Asticcacaulis aquaticus]MDC7681840.1 hypothetical protein [Asticcacaulis aquaticus]